MYIITCVRAHVRVGMPSVLDTLLTHYVRVDYVYHLQIRLNFQCDREFIPDSSIFGILLEVVYMSRVLILDELERLEGYFILILSDFHRDYLPSAALFPLLKQRGQNGTLNHSLARAHPPFCRVCESRRGNLKRLRLPFEDPKSFSGVL